jgi:thioredoxin-like negative regulator of GroEL
LLLFRDGQLVDQTVGARGADQLQAWVEGALAGARS